MTIKKFIIFSLIVHTGIFICLYFLPEGTYKKPAEFITRLVSPEEVQKPPTVTPPLQPFRTKKAPLPLPEKAPLSAARPKSIPSPDKPLVPGFGKQTGEQLPDGKYPESVQREKGGEDAIPSPPRKGAPEGPGRQGKYSDTLRGKLYDAEVIGDIALKDTGSKPKKDEAITFDTSDYRYAGYMRKLRDKIESIWIYPPAALARGLYGDLKIQFTIRKDGKLGPIELVRTSGYKMLDDAAIKALQDGEPYWPIPEQWGMESYTILGHFVYSLYGYSLR